MYLSQKSDLHMNQFQKYLKKLQINQKIISEISLEMHGQDMEHISAGEAWEQAVNTSETNLTKEDTNVLLMLSKMLGQTDVEGQISQIEVTETFLEKQIAGAVEEKNKNEKLYRKLGTTIGLAIVIILV